MSQESFSAISSFAQALPIHGPFRRTVERINFRADDCDRDGFRFHALTFDKPISLADRLVKSAAGKLTFEPKQRDTLEFTLIEVTYRGRPMANFWDCAQVEPEFHEPSETIFKRAGLKPTHLEIALAWGGPDFPRKVQDNPEEARKQFPRMREPGWNKFQAACQEVFEASGLQQALLAVRAPRTIVERTLSYDIAKNSIYGLIDEGASFATIDKAARTKHMQEIVPFDAHDPHRIAYAVRYLVKAKCNLHGDGGRALDLIAEDLFREEGLESEKIDAALCAVGDQRGLCVPEASNKVVWLKPFYEAEVKIAKIVRHINQHPLPSRGYPPVRCSQPLGPEQIDGVKMASCSRLSALTGPPGSGKTQTLEALVNRFLNTAIIAVSARAKEQARDLTGCRQCWTIAQCIGCDDYPGDPDKLRGLDLLIIEEASMVSSEQMVCILEIAFGGGTKRVLLCGDRDQLGPIDAGSPFSDLMGGF
jgi:hypothetical protein